MNRTGYIIDPYGTKQRVANLDTLSELAASGVIHAGTIIHDEAANKIFTAGSHPYLKSRCRPAPAAPPPPMQPVPAPVPVEMFTPPPGQEFVFGEMTRQYRNLVFWQIAGLAILLDGPILLIFLYWTGLIYAVGIAAILFPVMVAVFPTFACGGLIYALFKKPSLRQSIAAMGIDPQKWSRSMEHPLKIFWIVSAAFTAFIVIAATVVALVNAGQARGERLNHRTSPTLYEYEYQRRNFR